HFGHGMEKTKIILEPGRLLVGNAGVLLTTVLYKKTRDNKNFIIIDAGMNDLIRPALYGSYHEIIPIKRVAGRCLKADIVGPVCESADFMAVQRKISARIKEGSVLAILSAGAYGFSMTSNYNSRPRPIEVLIDFDRFEIIRRRETFDDLISHEH
ncbi:MAG: diaminopimelate decarboxylase, partial [Candidatus Poribacteria bacterium]